MNKVLIICGPTATGKTSLGIKLAKQFNGEIISADSRQVYRGMDIGTGKGVPTNAQFLISNFQNTDDIGYYMIGSTKIWGYDLSDPNTVFNVADYRKLMLPVVEDIISRGKLPIIVGGTGFYIDALVDPPETIGVEINQKIRKELDQLTRYQLQERLAKIDNHKLSLMNNSDRNNPRRLLIMGL